MAEKNDDIKNLFLNLGLNPSDYHEIRSAPSANATVSEAPRRWSLLQAAAANRPVAAAIPVPVLSTVMPPVPPPAFAMPLPVAAEIAPATRSKRAEAADNPISSSISAALFAAASDIARAESRELPSAPTPPSMPAAPAPAFAFSNPADDLRSLFQSVKEPQTISSMPDSIGQGAPTERRTDQLFGRSPEASSPAERAALLSQQGNPVLTAPPARLVPDDEAETRIEPPPSLSRLGPLPAMSPAAAVARAPVAEGRLRFAPPAPEPMATSANGDSLQDVFLRLSRDNHRV